MPTKGLLIRQPWLDHILAGRKRWEIRGQACHHRGPIALIASGTGHVCAVAEVVDCLGPLDETLWQHGDRLGALAGQERAFVRYHRSFAWVLAHVQPLRTPVPYVHPQGAVIWVTLAPDVRTAVQQMC